MAVTFRITRSLNRPVEIVEIFVDGKMAGVIYPTGSDSINIISAHIVGHDVEPDFAGRVLFDSGEGGRIPIPAISITFYPSPYEIRGGKLIKKGH